MYRIGIIGGGQLGKMMILDAKRLDTYFVILDPTPKCPADSIAAVSYTHLDVYKRQTQN